MAQTRTPARSPAGSAGHAAADARIGATARVRGRIHGDGDLVIEGHVEGDVTLRGDLTIAEGASVASESVTAHAVTIAGSLEGNLVASGQVRLAPGARVRGDVQGNAVAIDDGAHFSGRLDCEFELPPELGGAPQGEARGRASARR
jgi:cytoskeletal protein CcmA (bactofilin family)